jgi:signal transduction histidine kinase
MIGPDTRSGGRQAGRPGPVAKPPSGLARRTLLGAAQDSAADAPAMTGSAGLPRPGGTDAGGQARRLRRGSLSNWPVSARLGAVFALASVLGLVFGGVRVAEAVGTANADARTTQLVVLGQQDIVLAQALEDERDLSAGVAAYTELSIDAVKAGKPVRASIDGTLTNESAELQAAERITDAAASRTRALATAIGPAFPASVQAKAQGVITMIDSISGLRDQLTSQPAAQVVSYYSESISVIFTLQDEIASGSGDAALADDTRALSAISRSKDQASQQRAILYSTLIEVSTDDAGTTRPFSNINGSQALIDSGGLGELTTAQGLQFAYATDFNDAATPAQSAAYEATVAGQPDETMGLLIGFVELKGDPRLIFEPIGKTHSLGFDRADVAATWYDSGSEVMGQLRSVETQLATTILTRSQALEHDAINTAILTSAVTAAAVLLVLLLTALVARSLVRPLRRLQADALEIAAVRLPAQVAAAASGADLGDGPPVVEPIGVRSTDEIGRVARAFDQVHAEALRLAGNEAQLRSSLNAMFISLSRRSVPLIDKLARMIDSLEQNEDDPEQLADLFAMDHLVTRMRRNSENLLVLGGEEQVRKWGEPVPLTDVARAATAEIEQYNRVALVVQPGLLVSGQAAADVVHLLAELIENATLFSPRETQIKVTAQVIDSGGAMVEVRDGGVGISDARLAEMNFRLDHPPVVDVSVSRHMGLYAVSRLAARHGIRVRLRAGNPQGVSALVWLPETLTPQQPTGLHSRPRGLEGRAGLGGAGSGGADSGGAGSGGAGWGGADSGGADQGGNGTGILAPAQRNSGRHRSGVPATADGQPLLGAHTRRPAAGPGSLGRNISRSGSDVGLGAGGAGGVAGSAGADPAGADPAGADPAGVSRPGSGSADAGNGAQAAQSATAWFRAKRPSGGRPAPSQAELTVGWREPADMWGGVRPGQPEQTRQTNAGLPVRVPRSDLPARTPHGDLPVRTPHGDLPVRMPESDLPVRTAPSGLPTRTPQSGLPVRTAPSGLPTRTPQSGLPVRVPRAGARPGNDMPASGLAGDGTQARDFPHERTDAPLLGTPPAGPARRTPDAVRSRLTGFQLGSRDAEDTGRSSGWTSQQGEETGR